MFFWKDMLARRKRESKLEPSENKYKRTKIQVDRPRPLSSVVTKKKEITINRKKRSQADDHWPIAYKGDAQKKSYKDKSRYLKRRKRIVSDDDTDDKNENNNMDFSLLFSKIDTKSIKKDDKKKRDVDSSIEISVKRMKINNEEILHRSKRTEIK